MKKVYFIWVVLLLSACDKTEPVFKKMSQQGIILAFGDSLTYGLGAAREENYPSILSQLSAHKVINAGVSGEVTGQGLERLPRALDEHQPEVLILIHGGNDILQKIPLQQTHDNLVKMIALAKQRGIKVLMLGVPKPNVFLMESAKIYRQIAEQQNVPINLDKLPEILGNNQLKSDMIHPNAEGYALMAETVYQLLVESGLL